MEEHVDTDMNTDTEARTDSSSHNVLGGGLQYYNL